MPLSRKENFPFKLTRDMRSISMSKMHSLDIEDFVQTLYHIIYVNRIVKKIVQNRFQMPERGL